jgi:hypothetical protein
MIMLLKIRAIQGHSIKGIDNVRTLNRTRLIDMPTSGGNSRPEVLAHGTSRWALKFIMQQGLKAGGNGVRSRNDNHFTPIVDLQKLAESTKKEVPGFRKGCEVVVFVKTSLALEAGCNMTISPGGAVLCPELVPRHCIIAAVSCPNGMILATGPALQETTETERMLCGLPCDLGGKPPTGGKQTEEKASGSRDARVPPEPKRRREDEDEPKLREEGIGGKPPTPTDPEYYQVQCPFCNAWQSATLNVCMDCMAPLTDEWRGEVETTLSQLLDALVITRRWTDRGPRSVLGDQRRRLLKYSKRAAKLGFSSCRERFFRDGRWRAEMLRQGWDANSIGYLDEVKEEGTPNAPDAGRRSREQRAAAATYFHRHEDRVRQQQAPIGLLDRPLDVQITNARRREAGEYWRSQASWERSVGDHQTAWQQSTAWWNTEWEEADGSRWREGQRIGWHTDSNWGGPNWWSDHHWSDQPAPPWRDARR